MTETVYIPIKRLTNEYGKPTCWSLGVGACPCLKCERLTDYCGAVGVVGAFAEINNEFTPHTLCPVWSDDAIRLQAPPNGRQQRAHSAAGVQK